MTYYSLQKIYPHWSFRVWWNHLGLPDLTIIIKKWMVRIVWIKGGESK